MDQHFLMKFGLLFVCLMAIVIPASADDPLNIFGDITGLWDKMGGL